MEFECKFLVTLLEEGTSNDSYIFKTDSKSDLKTLRISNLSETKFGSFSIPFCHKYLIVLGNK